MKKHALDLITNEEGFVLGGAILVSAILIMAGVLALWTSTTEVQVVRNEGQMTREFYNAEAGIIDALENYNTGSTQWLTNDFLMAGPLSASSTVVSNDASGNTIATIEARCIESTGTAISGLSDAANTFPHQPHSGPPPVGSGYSLKYFEVRRYSITATSTEGNTHIQVGAWKIFNKY